MSFSKFVVFTLVGRQTFLLLLPFIKSQGRIELVYIFIVHKQRLVIWASALEISLLSLFLSGMWAAGLTWQKNSDDCLAASRFSCCRVNAVIRSVSQVK